MHPNHAAVQLFMKAQDERDPVRLDNALHPDATLVDPIVGELHGLEVVAWWQMLWRFKNHAVTIVEAKGAPLKGDARWKLGYTHPKSRRAMLVDITSEFEFKDGRIIRQVDSYGVYDWCRQALGTPGMLFGWLPPLHLSLRSAARERLGGFIREHSLDDDNRLLEAVKKKRRGESIPDVGSVRFARRTDGLTGKEED